MNWRAVTTIIVIALCAMPFFSTTGVREIHHADRVTNFSLVDPRPRTEDWPWSRGTDGRNVVTSDQFPLQWPVSDNEGWRVPVSGRGHATPCLWGNQCLVLTSDPDAQRISLHSYDRQNGRAMWQTELHKGGLPKIDENNSHASAMPACDGQYVYTVAVAHETLWLTSVDLAGRIAWQKEAGRYSTNWGYRSSPALYKSLVIVVADQNDGSFLAALHRQTGDIIWRIKRPAGESYGTPVITTIAGKPQLILGGRRSVTSYDPATGDQLWTFRWTAGRVANTVAFDDEHVFATSKQPDGEVVCIRADGSGDVTRTHLVWRQSKIGCEIPSPVHFDGLLYVLGDDGRLICLEASTGKIEWRKRLDGNFSASPIIAGDRLICTSEAGVTYVLQTGSTGKIIAENSLSEKVMASPIIAGGSVFVRTTDALHCISTRNSEPVVETPKPYRRRL